MIKSGIAKRYAQALFEIAQENNDLERYYRDMKSFSSLVAGSRDLQEFMANPIFDREDRKAVVTEVLKRTDVSPTAANFLKLLVDKGRINILEDIQGCYQELMDQALKMARVAVRTAYPLSPELTEGIRDMLRKLTEKNVEMSIEEDPSLLAGIVVKIGDKVYDGSIQSQLNSIRQLLGEEK